MLSGFELCKLQGRLMSYSKLAIHLSSLASILYLTFFTDLFLFPLGKKRTRGRAVNPHLLPMSLTTLILRITGKEDASDSDSDPLICKSKLWIWAGACLGSEYLKTSKLKKYSWFFYMYELNFVVNSLVFTLKSTQCPVHGSFSGKPDNYGPSFGFVTSPTEMVKFC